MPQIRRFFSTMLGVATLFALSVSVEAAEKIRVACVGDSITVGVGAGKGKGWPMQLQELLGDKFEVKGYAKSGTTLSTKGDSPYVTKGPWQDAQNFNAQIVIIKLGTNDTKPKNITQVESFVPDLTAMVDTLNGLKTKSKIFLCLPCYVPPPGNFGINEESLVSGIIPAINKVAADKKLPIIDVHAATKDHPEVFPDRVHPNDAGAEIIAKTVYAAIQEALK